MLDRIATTHTALQQRLLAARHASGHWEGELSSSALSTATAISALVLASNPETRAPRHAPRDPLDSQLIASGVEYLAQCQNEDGGWGDTDRSHSNIATTMLVRAAARLAARDDGALGAVTRDWDSRIARATTYIDRLGGVDGLRRRYGRDKTFAVPILSNCALAGLAEWREVAPLPFELACFPQSLYRFLQMPVVSYAIPALVAIGQARHRQAPSRWPWMRLARRLAEAPSLRVLERMQPASGGYLEATPLTSFVVMNLAGIGLGQHPVVTRGLEFLRASVRDDGAWPIDTNLATWNTTLSINALAAGGEDVSRLGCLDWLLSCQHRTRHPYTGADPGGWGWTDLSGAVPDADDTPGALLALDAWRRAPSCGAAERERIERAADDGLRWLVGLQNRDGGWPTFCRGWGKLPFDRSGADLTAHALRALHAWSDRRPCGESTIRRGLRYLERCQCADGAWIPLWFGNQDEPNEENPVYGTARVLLALERIGAGAGAAARRGRKWLVESQRPDGGWGGSIEETAVAVEALAATSASDSETAAGPPIAWETALERGAAWLCDAAGRGELRAGPIGFYFARLWYYESLYPLIFATAALGRAHVRLQRRRSVATTHT